MNKKDFEKLLDIMTQADKFEKLKSNYHVSKSIWEDLQQSKTEKVQKPVDEVLNFKTRILYSFTDMDNLGQELRKGEESLEQVFFSYWRLIFSRLRKPILKMIIRKIPRRI
jgi:hypothetical protein